MLDPFDPIIKIENNYQNKCFYLVQYQIFLIQNNNRFFCQFDFTVAFKLNVSVRYITLLPAWKQVFSIDQKLVLIREGKLCLLRFHSLLVNILEGKNVIVKLNNSKFTSK